MNDLLDDGGDGLFIEVALDTDEDVESGNDSEHKELNVGEQAFVKSYKYFGVGF
jgi:hypothetical protein